MRLQHATWRVLQLQGPGTAALLNSRAHTTPGSQKLVSSLRLLQMCSESNASHTTCLQRMEHLGALGAALIRVVQQRLLPERPLDLILIGILRHAQHRVKVAVAAGISPGCWLRNSGPLQCASAAGAGAAVLPAARSRLPPTRSWLGILRHLPTFAMSRL